MIKSPYIANALLGMPSARNSYRSAQRDTLKAAMRQHAKHR